MVIEFGVLQEKCRYIAIVSGFILYAFGGRTIPAIEVSRQACRTSKMRFLRPHVVVFHGECVCSGEPILVLMSGGFFRVVDRKDHGSEKWWLRTAQIITAVGIQHIAVVFDLEEEIFHHATRHIDASVAHQSANN